MSRSDDLFARARRVIPGGVHSPVRAFTRVGGSPIFIDSAQGAELTDADGHRYTDFCMAFGPLIFGHGDPDVRAAVTAALERGWSYGAAEATSLELAELITSQIHWIDQVRFVNSGTEAVMSALRLARAATGRHRIIKFDGCYHGHADSMLMRSGSGLAGAARPDSAGVPGAVAQDTLVAPLDDADTLERIFAESGNEIAAVIIEPVPANFGLLPQSPAFIERAAELCRSHGALLIFDEVITGFRLAFGGYAETSGIHPDIVTWGKVIGGGFPVGAFAARRDLMDRLAPTGPVYQAGTLSANPVAMTAGLTTLRKLVDGKVYARLEALGSQLDALLARNDNVRLCRTGSTFWIVPVPLPNPPRAPTDVPPDIGDAYAPVFRKLLKAGIYLPPSPYEVCFLSAAHDRSHVEQLAEVVS